VEEAIGIVMAANAVNLPAVISFTVETDGKLPSGMTLKEAIEQVDNRVNQPPLYYMINCAHPTHFLDDLQKGAEELWSHRIKGIRANASLKSHAELDESTELDSGNPQELGIENQKIKSLFDHINVFGGCCGTDERHVREIVKQLKKKL
jgi:S-methylmethionine-dependent homocysteine/selenocysteine methylase